MKKTFLLLPLFSFCFNLVYAQSGNLDSSFGTNGIVKTDAGKDYSYELIGRKVLLQNDTSIYAVLQSGGQTLIGKKHLNGSIDSSYGQNGFSVSTALVPVSAAFQLNGKLVVAGYSFNGKADAYMMVRYNADGSQDKTFGSNGGTQPVYFPVTSVVMQSDGKIVVAGSVNDSINTYFAIARYNTEGNLDSSFSNDGKQATSFGFSKPSDMGGEYPESDLAYAAAIQKDGKIVVSGSAFNYASNSREFAIARYNADGNLDTLFDNDGKQTTNFGASENYAYSIAFQSNGKIVVAGYANVNGDSYDLAIARYNINGSPDNTFDSDGKLTTTFGSVDHNPNAVAIQKDGKIVAESDRYDGSNYDFAIARYNKDGSPDKTFNGTGEKVTDLGSSTDYANSVIIQNNGKIIEGGYTFNGDNYKLAIVRFNADGSTDNTFNKNGRLIEGLNQGYTIYTSSAVQKDGKIIAAGYTWNGSNFDFVVVRYNADGSLDNSFSQDGKQTTGFGSGDDFANAVSIQADGKIVLAGYTSTGNTSSYFALVRYNADGSLDSTFSSDGKQTTDFGFYAEIGNAAAIQSDGKIVIAGSVFTGSNYDSVDFAVARYNTDGTLDKTFSNDGKQLTDLTSSDDFGNSVVIQKDGKIIVAGRTYNGTKNDFALVRYNSNGSLDNTFSGDGKQVSDFGTADFFGQSAVLQNDGKIVVAGYSQVESVGSSFAIARYNTNGNLDTSFNGTGLKTRDFGSGFEVATSVAIQANGKIVVAGGTNGNFTLARYNTNGSLDNSFNEDGIQITKASGGDDRIQGITIANNELYVVGYGSYPATLGVAAKYSLTESNTPPTVALTVPANNTTRLAPAAHIKLRAVATDKDGTISKVEFYSGTKLLHTETVFPYGYVWEHVPFGNYTLTAKAYDNSGNVTTSAPVHISVVPNKPPVVSIIKPNNNQSFTAPGYIHLEAAASDTDGRVTNVKFYNGTTLLRTEYEYPYTYHWENVPVGTYTITAVATDNWGAHTTSAPVTIRVTSANAMMVSNKPIYNKTVINDEISLKLSPNPATNIVNIYTKGLQQNKQATISIISAAGIVHKTLQTNNSTTQLDVSSMASGVYTIKIVSGDITMYKKFVKL